MINLGVIGMSDGNGHPYSWSAIFNGYDREQMKECPFSVIPEYLSRQSYPADFISKARVTHIWTQNPKISEHISQASKIKNIVKDYKDMIGKVDGVLLARDDSENHKQFATPFIKAGLPIYIDKPIATNRKQLNYFKNIEQYENQIFTCSALRYGNEFILNNDERRKIGEIKYIDAYTMKSWEKYGVHIIEPIIKNYLYNNEIEKIKTVKIGDKTQVSVLWNNEKITRFNTFQKTQTPIKAIFYGENSYKKVVFQDAFNAFKNALDEFINICFEDKANDYSYNYLNKVVKIIERGLN